MIVVGVLVALGVDSWVSWRNDRRLEVEYLERLLDDVRYDLEEIAFVRAVAHSSSAYVDSLLTSGVAETMEDDRLIGAVVIASNSRTVDLSRSTFEELVNSGRIGLIRSRTVRSELSDYQRTFLELFGFWDRTHTGFQNWVRARVPNPLVMRLRAACRLPSAPHVSDPVEACPFDLGGWSAGGLRADLGSPEATRLLTYQGWRAQGTQDITETFRAAAEHLRGTLENELGLVTEAETAR